VLCAFGLFFEMFAVPTRAAAFDINTFASNFAPASGSTVSLQKPSGVATDAAGNVYVADTGNCVVWKFPSGGQTATVVAGQLGQCASSYSNANPTLDTLNQPLDVAVCNQTIYIIDNGVTPVHKVVAGVFSNIPLSYPSTLRVVGNAQPQALACDSTGDVFVESIYSAVDGTTYQYTLDTVSAAGVSRNISAEFDIEYQGIAVDAKGSVYTVRGNPAFGIVAKYTPTSGVWQEANLSQSRSLVGATRLAIDSADNLYVSEAAPPPAGTTGIVTPGAPVYVTELSQAASGTYTATYIAGNGSAGYSGDGGPALLAELNNVKGIAVGSTLYVADSGNNRIRELYALQTGPSTLALNDRIPNVSLNMAVNPTTNRLYLAVSRGNYTQGGPVEDIVVYNTVDDTVVANIPAASSSATVSFLAVDTVNDFIYASNANGTVTVIDGATNTIDSTLTVGNSPTGIAIDPNLNIAYVANSSDTFISVVHGPVRASGVITTHAHTLSSENISNLLPLGPIGVNPKTHTVYAITAGPANPGSETYTLTVINGATYTVTNNLAYLSNAGATSLAASALAVDTAGGFVVVADTEDRLVHVFNPKTSAFQVYAESFYPGSVAIDSTSEIAYISSGYGNLSQINLQTGSQVTVYPASGSSAVTSCGPAATAVGVDPSTGQAYFTTCDSTNLSRLMLWDGVHGALTATISLPGTPVGTNGTAGTFAVAVNTSAHVAYVANSTSVSETDVVNGPKTPASPQLSLSVNGAAAQPLDASQTINFGSVATGTTSASKTLEIGDGGTVAASISAPLVLGSGFALTTDSCALGSIAPGGLCDAGIVFQPNNPTSFRGGLAFFDSERDTPQLIGLSGTGIGSAALVLSPTSLPAGYVGSSYPPSGVPIQFNVTGGSGTVTLNLCQTLPSGQPGSLCCPVSQATLGPSCPAGLLPNGLNLAYNSLGGTPSNGSAGTYLLTLSAHDSVGDSANQNYTLIIGQAITVSAFKLSSSSVVGGTGLTATVTLNQAAPAAGVYVLINSSNTAVVPTNVAFVSTGQTTATVSLRTNPVSAVTPVTLTAYYSTGGPTATLTVEPVGPPPGSITLSEVVTVSDSDNFSDAILDESIRVKDTITLRADVPNVVGDARGVAVTDLTSVGLAIGTITYVSSLTVPAGEVISQSPGPTTPESSGLKVSLVISTGPPAPSVIREAVTIVDTVSISALTPSIVIVLGGAPVIVRTATELKVTLPITNKGNVSATVTETSGSLNGTNQSAAPPAITIPAGSTASLTVIFPSTAGASGATVPLAVSGTYAGSGTSGTWHVGARGMKLP
jgi:DNA-binding beta-propeller fold protein YncE